MTEIIAKRKLRGIEVMASDPRSIDELVEAALLEAESPGKIDRAKPHNHPAIAILHERGTRDVLDAGLILCRSADPVQRQVGAEILGQLGSGTRTFPEECCDALLSLLDDRDHDVVASAIFALGHLRNRRADISVAAFKHDPDDHIRHAVAFALVGTTSPEGAAALLELMDDSCNIVRDWSTHGIGNQVVIDGEEIRDALLKRAIDPDESTQAEALSGLARRGDRRVIPYLIASLEQRSRLDYLFVEAAKLFLGLEEQSQIERNQLIEMLHTES